MDEPAKILPGALAPDYKRRREAGEIALGPHERLLCEYMVFGTHHGKAKRLGFPLGEPLTLEQAARILDLRLRNARQILRNPQVSALMLQLTNELRTGERARNIRTFVAVRDDAGDNTAADRTVRVKAAVALMGDEGRAGVHVTVNNQLGVAFKPGYIIRLQPDAKDVSNGCDRPTERLAYSVTEDQRVLTSKPEPEVPTIDNFLRRCPPPR